MPAGEVASLTNPQCFYVPKDNNDEAPPPPPVPKVIPVSTAPPPAPPPTSKALPVSICDVCQGEGDNTNLVSCDECHKRYHFQCLEPPLKKSPKKRGYSWHCADCDPTVSSLFNSISTYDVSVNQSIFNLIQLKSTLHSLIQQKCMFI